MPWGAFNYYVGKKRWVGGPRWVMYSGVDSGGAGGARALPEFEGSEKGRSLISAFRSLAITASTPGFQKLSTALLEDG